MAAALAWPGPHVVRSPDDALGDGTQLHLSAFTEGEDLSLGGWGSAAGDPGALAGQARDLVALGYRVVVAAHGHGSLDRAREVLGDLELEGVEAPLAAGFVYGPGKIAVLTEEDLFGARRFTREAPRFASRRSDSVADELEPGDFAVHRIHGVGRYQGIVHRELAGSERDYLVLEYAKGDKLYVPSDAVGMVARYIGGDVPRVHRMGGSDWARATAKVKRAVRDMAGELVRLYTVRMSVPGHAFGPDTPWQRELEDAFPFEETPDQLRVIDDVKRDMEKPLPMDRLLCGDVGFGKTEVAVRAACKAVMEGKQAAVLVPTTLLAEQHLLTFRERFAPYPVRVEMLSRFVDPERQDAILAELAQGRVDIVIGTHRLLGRDVLFADLGLLIVDEEQRFGVSHKERLKSLRAQVDVLTMTATPIPRTLEMALTGIRQMSTIDTPPEDRQPVRTFVGSFDEELAVGAVRRELLREGQVFWVHNRVATIDRQVGRLQQLLPDASIVVAHGQMDEEVLERQMIRFWERDADILVCTTIIESGLDVPNANTLVVDRADLLGLAQLYQLRGRVGRAAERAFAYFFFPEHREMTEEAHLRLATISKHQALGSGFKIALRDLEIRGAGNLLGAEQSGHIASVGFDAYARILQESVQELQGTPIEQERELRIDLQVKAFVPPGWLAQESLRLELYRRIGMARDHEGLAMIRDETLDRFGALPDPVQVLFAIGSLRLTAQRLGVQEIATLSRTGADPSGHAVGGRGAGTVRGDPRRVVRGGDEHAEPEAGACLRCGPRPVGGGAAASGRWRGAGAGPRRGRPRIGARLVDWSDASLPPLCAAHRPVRAPRDRARRMFRRDRATPRRDRRRIVDLDRRARAHRGGVQHGGRTAAAALWANRRRHRHAGGGVQPVLARRDDPVPARRHLRERSRRHRRRREGDEGVRGLPEERRRRHLARAAHGQRRDRRRRARARPAVARAAAGRTSIASDQVSDADLQKQYQQSIGDYTTLHVDHILVDSKAKAEQIYQQVTRPVSHSRTSRRSPSRSRPTRTPRRTAAS